jgi:prolyl oligopeptidase
VVSTQLSGDNSSAPAWKDILPHHPKDLLKSAVALKGDFLLARYLKDVAGTLQLHQLSSGKLLQDVPMPVLGSVGVSGDRKNTEFFFSLASEYSLEA